jgi:formylglycine-generating enzyme
MTRIYSAALFAACACWTISAGRAAENLLEVDLGQGVKLELVLVKSGSFRQGSPSTEAGRNDDETPRKVAISKDFYVGKYPVTVAQFRRFADETGYRTEAEQGASGGFGFDGKGLVQRKEFTWQNPGYTQSDDRPVTIVTYDDAQAFAKWLGQKAGRNVRLPTEAQSEYACRAGTTTRFYSGDSEADLQNIGWYKANAGNSPQPVGKKNPNAFGLYDMSGNVYEWCADWYGPYGDDASDPEEKRSDRTSPPRRVLRGGSWLKEARQCRSAARYRNTPASRNADNGFRVAAEVAASAEQPEQQSRLPGDRLFEPQVTRADSTALFVIVILAAIVIVLFRAFQRVASGGGPSQPFYPPDGHPDPRPDPRRLMTGMGAGIGAGMSAGTRPHLERGPDGFWVHTAGLPVGSSVHYRYHVFGAPHHGSLVVEPGGRQFVYTGDAPDQIEVTQVNPADDDPGFTSGVTDFSGPNQIGPSQTDSSSDSTFSGPSQTDSSTGSGDFSSAENESTSGGGGSFGGFPSAY